MMNRKLGENGTSKYKGVCLNILRGKWIAYIQVNGRRIHLGYFIIEEDAAHAYDIACVKYHGEFAHLNFPSTI